MSPRRRVYLAALPTAGMALPTGLVPVAVFVFTVGLSAPIALGAHRVHRAGDVPFETGLEAAAVEAGALFLVGVGVVWAVAGGPGLWELAATLLLAGVAWTVLLMCLPLLVGRRLLQRGVGVDGDTALRFATYGWPVAGAAVFAVFVAPGGVGGGDLLTLGGGRVCLVGVCGLSVRLLAAVLVELVVVVLGPGVVGLALYGARTGRAGAEP